ncbi:MAG: transposase [Candidatus Acidiferrales bacterium]
MTRRKFDSNFKTKVALEAIKNDTTIAEIANKYGVHPTQVQAWKMELLAHTETAFLKANQQLIKCDHAEIALLERKVGQLAIENDFLKKNLAKYPKKNGK